MKRYLTYILLVFGSVSLIQADPWAGAGDVYDPYIITTYEELLELSKRVEEGNSYEDTYFRMENDIIVPDEDESIWQPIGTLIHPFAGTFDGMYHCIDNLNFHDGNYVGLFGCASPMAYIKNIYMSRTSGWAVYYMGNICGFNEGVIENCHTLNGTISCGRVIGGIVGVNMGIVRNCSNNSYVMSMVSTGGVVGFNNGEVINCSNTKNFDGDLGTGGIVGYNGSFSHIPCNHPDQLYAYVNGCTNSGEVLGGEYSGGIIGRNDGYLSNCKNSGYVEATNYGGGIAGVNGSEVNGAGYLYNSYNMGNVSVEDSIMGGICGYNHENSVVENVYNAGYVFHVFREDSIAPKLIYINEGSSLNCYDFYESMDDQFVERIIQWADTSDEMGMYPWKLEDSHLVFHAPVGTGDDLVEQDDVLPMNAQQNVYSGERIPLQPGSTVYSSTGALIFRNSARRERSISLPQGVYLMDNRKVIVR